jgi:hypothetical protein
MGNRKASIKRELDASDQYLFSKKLRCNMKDGSKYGYAGN